MVRRAVATIPPARVLRPKALSAFLLTCEHASKAMPPGVGDGVDGKEAQGVLATHEGYDIGALEVARGLAGELRATLVAARWSRLLVDLNRPVDDPELIRAEAGGVRLPWNRASGPAERERRVADYPAPYHAEIDRQSVWVARVFLASAAALVALLCVYGLPLDAAVLWTVGLSVMFLVVCRLVAEMGIPWTPLAGFGPLAVLLHILGKSALGAKVYSLMAVLNSVLVPERTSVLLMAPAVTNAAHVESRVLGRNPSLKVVGPFLLAVLAFSAAALVWLGYSHEGSGDDRHSFRVVTNASRAVGTMVEERAGKGVRGADADRWINEDLPFAARWAAARPTEGFSVWLLALGFGLVVATGYLRLRLPKFPLHPLPLVLLGTWLMSRYWMCFLIGWGLKQLILRIGGGRLFEKGRPFFTGIVIGQAAVLLVWVIVNIVLFWKNGLVFDRNWWTFMTWMYSG